MGSTTGEPPRPWGTASNTSGKPGTARSADGAEGCHGVLGKGPGAPP